MGHDNVTFWTNLTKFGECSCQFVSA